MARFPFRLTPKLAWTGVWALLLSWIFLLFLQQTNLAASDLGRHLANGRIIWQSQAIFQTNFYSYTNQDFIAPNHHWLFGVIVFAAQQLGSFAAVTAVVAFVYWLSLCLMIVTAKKMAGNWPAFLATIVLLPMMAMRQETRPEAFTMLGLALTLLCCQSLWHLPSKRQPLMLFIITIITMLIWVNVHILFILGLATVASFLLCAVLEKNRSKIATYGALLIGQLVADLCNPLGWRTLIYPLTILHDYQYPVAENQSLWFFLQYHPSAQHWYLLVILSSIGALLTISYRKVEPVLRPWWLLTGALTVATAVMIRFSAFLVIPSIVVLATAIAQFRRSQLGRQFFVKQWWEDPPKATVATVATVLVLAVLTATSLINPFQPGFGLGVTPGAEAAADFFIAHDLPGPIFNNYDIGGFLIYKLFPKQRVFVDNRPEAYPGSFMTDAYIAGQKDEAIWQKLDQQYQFQTIFFYRHDATDWAIPFLNRRLKDAQWAPVYLDGYSLILVRNIPANTMLIDRFRLQK